MDKVYHNYAYYVPLKVQNVFWQSLLRRNMIYIKAMKCCINSLLNVSVTTAGILAVLFLRLPDTSNIIKF
jgi:hypothetical protein